MIVNFVQWTGLVILTAVSLVGLFDLAMWLRARSISPTSTPAPSNSAPAHRKAA